MGGQLSVMRGTRQRRWEQRVACGGGEVVAPRGPMVDGVEGEQLREGHQLLTMGGGVGGRRVGPRRAGRKYFNDVRDLVRNW